MTTAPLPPPQEVANKGKKGSNRTKEVPLKQCFDRKQFTIGRKTNPQRSVILALRGRILIETLNLRRNTFDPLPLIFLSYIFALIALKMPSVYLQKQNKKRSCFSLSTLLVLLLLQQKISTGETYLVEKSYLVSNLRYTARHMLSTQNRFNLTSQFISRFSIFAVNFS